MTTAQVTSPWLTIHQLAERLQTTAAAVYKLRQHGQCPRGVRVGKSLRFHIADVEQWEQDRREASA